MRACGALIADGGALAFDATSKALDHEHTPVYPIGAPAPGTWSFHS